MKKKQHITITIDTETYLKLRLLEDVNVSGLINEFLNDFLKDEREQEEILKKELEEIKNRKAILEYELEKKRREKEKEEMKRKSEKEQEKLDLINSIPKGNDFHSNLAREKLFKEHPELKKYYKM